MSRQTIAVSVKASKLTARALAYVVAAVGRKIAKEHRKAQTPHGKQSVRKLMGHGGDTNAIEVDTPTFSSTKGILFSSKFQWIASSLLPR